MSDETMSAAEAKGSRSRVATVEYSAESDIITWAFVTGDKVELNVRQVPTNIFDFAAKRGMAEAVRDGYASMGKDIPAAFAKAQERVQGFLSGDWGKTRDGEGDGLGALWVEAVARYRKYVAEDGSWDLSKAREQIKKILAMPKGEDKIAELKASATIKTLVLQIRKERAEAALAKANAEASAGGEAANLDSLFEAA